MARFLLLLLVALHLGTLTDAYTSSQLTRDSLMNKWHGSISRRPLARAFTLRAAISGASPGDNHYATLGVGTSASLEDIHKAYEQLAKKWHPDKNKDPQAPLKMAAIDRAFDVLKDPTKRSKYDQMGEEGLKRHEQAEAPAPVQVVQPETTGTLKASELGRESDEDDESEYDQDSLGQGGNFFDPIVGGLSGIDDLLSEFFGAPTRRQARPRQQASLKAQKQQGQDITVECDVGFETGAFGGPIQVSVRRQEACPDCNGFGIKRHSKPSKCRHCDGNGVVVKQVQTHFGQMVTRSTCGACGGTGKTTQQPCPTCNGKALQPVVRTVNVTIPACTENGALVRLAGAGDTGVRGGAAGDLLVKVNVLKHPRFDRRGPDVYSNEEVSYLDAILGTDLQVHTMTGVASLKVLPGSQPGQELRLHGFGAPKSDAKQSKGDHVVRLKVKLPAKLSAAEKEALEKLRKSQPSNSPPPKKP